VRSLVGISADDMDLSVDEPEALWLRGLGIGAFNVQLFVAGSNSWLRLVTPPAFHPPMA
jgi:hypothetical protein